MAEVYPTEVWPSDAVVAQLDGTMDPATGLPYIARGTGPTSSPPLEIQYNRGQQRLKRMLAPWNQGRVVDEGGGRIGVYPLRYWMNGSLQQFQGATGVDAGGDGSKVVYIDQDGLLQVAELWPGEGVSFIPLAEVLVDGGAVSVVDARPQAAFRVGSQSALWQLTHGLVLSVAEAGADRDVTIQVTDAAGTPTAGLMEVHTWLSDAPQGGVTAASPSGGANVVTGTLLVTENNGRRWRLLTSGTGTIVLRVIHAGSRVWYLNAQAGGRVVTSGDIQF